MPGVRALTVVPVTEQMLGPVVTSHVTAPMPDWPLVASAAVWPTVRALGVTVAVMICVARVISKVFAFDALVNREVAALVAVTWHSPDAV